MTAILATAILHDHKISVSVVSISAQYHAELQQPAQFAGDPWNICYPKAQCEEDRRHT